MSLGLLLLIIVVLLLVGAFPGGPAPWAANWGYGPSSLLGLVLVILLVLLLVGRLHI